MIIQRDFETSIWGEAADGSTVTVAFAGQSLQTAAKDGKWQLKLPAVPAGPAYEISITSGTEKIIIKDILAGEVWIAGGQSNMEWPLKNSVGGKEAIAAANYRQIGRASCREKV